MRTRFPLRALALVVAFVPVVTAAQQRPKSSFEFTIKNIMRGPEVYGREPSQVRWTPDGQWIYFQWLPPGTDYRETLKPYRVRPAPGSVPERVTPTHMDSVGPLLAAGSLAADRQTRVVEFRGDIYLVDLTRSEARRLTETQATEFDVRLAGDGKRVLFVRDGNGYAIELATGTVKQLTSFRNEDGARRGGSGNNPQRSALEADQRFLFESVRDQLRADSIRKADSASREALLPRTVVLNAGERVPTVSVSPNGSAMVFTTTTSAADSRSTIVPNFVTTSGYTEDITVRTKVGDAVATARLGFQALPRGEVKWLRPITGDSTPPGIVFVAGWNEAGTNVLVVAGARNFKTRQLSVVDAATGTLTPLAVMRDSAWVGGPCGFGCIGFYEGDRRVYFVDESSGFAQLYSIATDGSDRRALTQGRWEIFDVALSADRQSFLFHSSETSPYDRDYWRMPITGGARIRLTVGEGFHEVALSPDERQLARVYSVANRPGDLFVGEPGVAGAQLTTSPTAEWLSFPWIKPEIVMIPASDGVPVPARIYRPREMGAAPNNAAVIFVHGAGYLHNVHHYWSSYAREYMFHHFLASKGYVVLDIDYRASAGYGRDWRTAIYRWMGGRDLQDQVDGSRFLTQNFRIPPERIGIYGGSYGGFITLMALFTAPKFFGAGAALRSVTDWAHYNNGYTGSILNFPQADTVAYRRSSPIFFAEGLEDPLLMAHGMIDTNVHFQDIVRLTQRLIELGKTRWELAVYPVEDHGFVRPASWADEYTRIFELFERHLVRR